MINWCRHAQQATDPDRFQSASQAVELQNGQKLFMSFFRSPV